MRPDEHKKKKNAQYKKVHGIGNSADKVLEKQTKDTRSKKVQEKIKQDVRQLTHSVTPKRGQVQPQNSAEDGSSDEDVSIFRRRQVASNWNRYDLSSDSDDEPIQRGEHFNKILAQTGGSAAQFRFKEEEDWDDGRDTTLMLTLDLDDLSQSLACVPLHQRLGLEDNLFLNEQTAEFIAEASKQKDILYTQDRKSANKPVRKMTKTKSTKVSRERRKAGSSRTARHIANGVSDNAENIGDENIADDLSANIMNANGKTDKCKDVKSTTEPTITKTKDVLDLEDDLDALLEQEDSLCITTRIPMMEAYRLATSKKPDASAQTTGAVLPTKTNNATQSPKPQNTDHKDTGNLEDMLDALLDD